LTIIIIKNENYSIEYSTIKDEKLLKYHNMLTLIGKILINMFQKIIYTKYYNNIIYDETIILNNIKNYQ